MPTIREEDGTWVYSPQTPLGAGFEKGDYSAGHAVYIMYLEDHMEICYLLQSRIEELIGKPRSMDVIKYAEPLGVCLEDNIVVEPYGCTLWCRGGIEHGAYPFPV